MTTRLSNTEYLTVLDDLPRENIGWTLRALSEQDYVTQIALINRFVGMGFTDEVTIHQVGKTKGTSSTHMSP